MSSCSAMRAVRFSAISSAEAVCIHWMALAMAFTARCTRSGLEAMSSSEAMTVNSS